MGKWEVGVGKGGRVKGRKNGRRVKGRKKRIVEKG